MAVSKLNIKANVISVKQKEKKHLVIYVLSLLFVFLNSNLWSQSIILNKKVSSIPMIRLKMNGLPNYLDETVIYYQTGATDGFDSEYDAYKLLGPNPAPHISQECDSILMVINGVAPVVQTFSMSINATTNITGNFTITATDFAFLPPGTCVYLNDLFTGSRVNILTNPYVFNLSNTTTESRFVLTITHYELPITANLIQPTCQNLNGAKFKAMGNGYGPWNYVWKDSTGVIIKNSIGLFNPDSLININSGIYSLEITSTNNSCYYIDTTFYINEIILPSVTFSSPDTLNTNIIHGFTPTNQSTNCESYYWDFGDGLGNSDDIEPTYNYAASGTFITKLVGISSTGCIDSSAKNITIIDLTTYIKNEVMQKIKLLNMGNNNFMIKLNKNTVDELDIALYNLEGKNLLMEHKENLKEIDCLLLDLNFLKNGVYIFNISSQNTILSNSKVIIN